MMRLSLLLSQAGSGFDEGGIDFFSQLCRFSAIQNIIIESSC
jgi:hypothetical protein